MCREQQAPAAVSICESSKHPNWMFYCGENGIMSPFMDFPIATRRQGLPIIYTVNGALYLAKTTWLKENKSFFLPIHWDTRCHLIGLRILTRPSIGMW